MVMTEVAGFDWDEGNGAKCAKHGVTRAEIEYAFQNDPLVLPDRTGATEPRFNAVGVTALGRFVFVVYTLRERASGRLIRPISARYMHRKEIEAVEKARQTQAVPGLQFRRGG